MLKILPSQESCWCPGRHHPDRDRDLRRFRATGNRIGCDCGGLPPDSENRCPVKQNQLKIEGKYFLMENYSEVSHLWVGPELRTHNWCDRVEKKKLGPQWDLNPRPQEFAPVLYHCATTTEEKDFKSKARTKKHILGDFFHFFCP